MVMSRGHLTNLLHIKYDDGLIILEYARFIKKEKKSIDGLPWFMLHLIGRVWSSSSTTASLFMDNFLHYI